MVNQVARKALTIVSAVAMLAGCSKGGGSYSTLADSADYQQEAVYVPRKIDILWVIDNSGSMASSQANLASNFQSFISRFNQYNYDFHMAVSTTDAWEKEFYSTSTKARIRDGAVLVSGQSSTHSGYYVIDKNTPNMSSVFETNIKQGTLGNGDERAFESFYQTLGNEAFNTSSGFRRPDAFLAIIIVSDEDDFSNSTVNLIEDYNSSYLYPISKYTDFLNSYTGGVAGTDYSVSSISTLNQSCYNSIYNGAQKISVRYPAIADATGGVKASICDNFGTSLQLISDSIIQLSSSFKLSRAPVVSSIVVTVNGVSVVQDAANGWTYDESSMVLTFHGSSVPAASASISIKFDPVSIKL